MDICCTRNTLKIMLLHRLPNPIIFCILDSDCKEKLPFNSNVVTIIKYFHEEIIIELWWGSQLSLISALLVWNNWISNISKSESFSMMLERRAFYTMYLHMILTWWIKVCDRYHSPWRILPCQLIWFMECFLAVFPPK